MNRRSLLAGFAALGTLVFWRAALAQLSPDGVKGMLGNASDSALDKLSQPGAFSADSAIRIALPGTSGGGLGDMMKLADKAGLTKGLDENLNHAAEQAAAQAKPIFRNAIDRMSLKDMGNVVTGGNTAATDYLKKTSSGEILEKLTPLVNAALAKTGVLQQTSQLSQFGMTPEKLTGYVSQKTSDGIFTYVGREETRMRANPLESGKTILKGLKF
jgi:Protein of unknown function (DUF4197)